MGKYPSQCRDRYEAEYQKLRTMGYTASTTEEARPSVAEASTPGKTLLPEPTSISKGPSTMEE